MQRRFPTTHGIKDSIESQLEPSALLRKKIENKQLHKLIAGSL